MLPFHSSPVPLPPSLPPTPLEIDAILQLKRAHRPEVKVYSFAWKLAVIVNHRLPTSIIPVRATSSLSLPPLSSYSQ